MPLGEEVEQQPPLLGSNKCPTKSLRATDFQRTHAASNPVTLPECAVLKLRARPNGSARFPNSGRELSLQKLQSVYEHPISTAAAHLNIGVTVLKMYCRWYSIDRWPYRKIRSIDKLIEQLDQLEDGKVVPEVRQELETVRQQLLGDPAVDLDDRVKRLRQAAYKYQYKRRQSRSKSCIAVSD
ncbi:hypothetical protein ABBQ38_010551 [Trebouxia sp. C0009 RCD-2024]